MSLTDVPVDPDRQQAQQWLVQELSRKEYRDARPSLIERALEWIQDRFDDIRPGFGSPVQFTVTVLAVLLVTAVAFAIWRSGGIRRQFRRRAPAVLPNYVTTAAGHRAAADQHARAGQWADAVLERFRAIARELAERTLVPANPGATATEVARAGGLALPDLAADLRIAARHFDDVCYGHLELTDTAGNQVDAFLRGLDERVRSAKVTASVLEPAGQP